MDRRLTEEAFMTSRREFFALAGAAALPALTPTAMAQPAGPTLAVTQIRNATMRIDYAGVRFLLDPMLAEKGAYPGFEGTPNSELRNPLVHMPFSLEEVIAADAVIVTHLHPDHWDEAAKAALPKAIPIFAQNEDDAAAIRAEGFEDVRVLGDATKFNGVMLTRTDGMHGSPETVAAAEAVLGKVSGVVLSHPDAPTLYVAGDTVWNDMVQEALSTHAPEIVILNAGFAQITGRGPILMGTEGVKAVAEAAPAATLIATHMEAVNHCILTRAELRTFAATEGFAARLHVPGDGETIRL